MTERYTKERYGRNEDFLAMHCDALTIKTDVWRILTSKKLKIRPPAIDCRKRQHLERIFPVASFLSL